MFNLATPETRFLLSLFFIIVFYAAVILALKPAYKRRHQRNIEKSHHILAKLQGFTEPHRTGKILSYLRKCDPYVFEEILLTALSQYNIKIERNRAYSGDGGWDGKCYIKGHELLIQAKRYKGYIRAEDVADFVNIIGPNQHGLFIHTGRTGKKARINCAGKVTIISGDTLAQLMTGETGIEERITGIYNGAASSRHCLSSRDEAQATV